MVRRRIRHNTPATSRRNVTAIGHDIDTVVAAIVISRHVSNSHEVEATLICWPGYVAAVATKASRRPLRHTLPRQYHSQLPLSYCHGACRAKCRLDTTYYAITTMNYH